MEPVRYSALVRPLLAVSLGCPSGIGPDVVISALADARRRGSCERREHDIDVAVFGDVGVLRSRADMLGVSLRFQNVASAAEARGRDEVCVVDIGLALAPEDARPGAPTRAGGAAQLAWIDAACDAVSRGEADAIVTGPVSKSAIASSGARGSEGFLGHTEHFGARLGGLLGGGPIETVMAFHAESLTITLATTHVPISQVATRLTIEDVARATYWTTLFVDDLGVDEQRPIAVLSLNPHAGEAGLLGDEETRILAPGIERARARLVAEGHRRTIVGPLPAEGAIRRAVRERAFAACVAMYHDQATIPSKLVAFGEAVNVTLGLPIIRTSVDHGTAYDLAGTGRADAAGMSAAIELAERLVRRRRARAITP